MDDRSTCADPSPREPALPLASAAALPDTASSSSASILVTLSVLSTSSSVGPRQHVTSDGAHPSEDDMLSTEMAATATTTMNTTLYAIAKYSAAIFSQQSVRISVIAMTGAVIAIDDASAVDTILSVKRRVFAANCKLHVRRQRLMYRPGPHGIEPLADDETLGGVEVAQDGLAELDVLLADLTEAEAKELGSQFLSAVRNGRANEMLQLMGEGANMELVDEFGYTALILAAEKGHTDCVRLLLEGGADMNAEHPSGWTALMCAAHNGYAECARLLVAAGADKNARDHVRDPTRQFRIDAHVYHGFASSESQSGFTALICTALFGHIDTLRALLEVGARIDTDAETRCGSTALIRAAENGHTEFMRLLLEAGANKDFKGKRGATALYWAATFGHADCVRLLVDAGADTSALDDVRCGLISLY